MADTSTNTTVADDPLGTNQKPEEKTEQLYRRSICRYGPGCTHKNDPNHKEKFWHPSLPKLNDEQLKSQFICNECGYGTSSLTDLQFHLKKKSAWSNSSLVGCRISCLVDYKEWHEGIVTQFHKSGKHFVEFRAVSEKRWLTMKKIAFYIVERPSANTTITAMPASPKSSGKRNIVMVEKGNVGSGESEEFKETEDQVDPTLNDPWVFCEDISTDYAFAQSVLFKVYGNLIQETGHLTKGHLCLTESDRVHAQYIKGSLLYGELLPRGANKAFGSKRLDAAKAEVLFDLGMGTGKILLQSFLQFKNLKYVYGVELSQGRYKLAEEAVLRMVNLLGADNYQVEISTGKYVIVTEAIRNPEYSEAEANTPGSTHASSVPEFAERILHMECGNMFDVTNVDIADIVMMETDVPAVTHSELIKLLDSMHEGSRLLTYLDLRRIWEYSTFKQLECNRHLSDRYPTSWSVQRGHHFYFWVKGQSDGPPGSPSNLASTLATAIHSAAAQQQQQQQQQQSSDGSSPITTGPATPLSKSLVHAKLIKNNSEFLKKSHEPPSVTPGSPMNRSSSGPEGPDEDLSFMDDRCLPSFFSLSWLFRCGRSRNAPVLQTLSDVKPVSPLKKYGSGSNLRVQDPFELEIRRKLSAAAVSAAGISANNGNSGTGAVKSSAPIDRDTGKPMTVDTRRESFRNAVIPPEDVTPPPVSTKIPSSSKMLTPRQSPRNPDPPSSDDEVLNQIFPKRKSRKNKKNRQQVSPRVEKTSSVSPKQSQSPRGVSTNGTSSQSAIVVPLSKTAVSSSAASPNGSFRRVPAAVSSAASASQSGGLYFPIENSGSSLQRYFDAADNSSNVPSPTFDECDTPIDDDDAHSSASPGAQKLKQQAPFTEGQEYLYSLPVSGLRTPPNAEFAVSSSTSPSQMLSFLSAPSPLSVSTPASGVSVDLRSPDRKATMKQTASGKSGKTKMSSLSENPIDNSNVTASEIEVLSAR